jgi:glycosyltransferase involved in cell wall biosynthesis
MNFQSPIVSAVIPTRNRPDLVVRAAMSALQQTLNGLEVIVVVDGTDPATLRALWEISDPRLRVIGLEESAGGAEARNIGVRAANGQWIALLDDDDEWLPGKLEKQLAAARSSTAGRVLVVSAFLERSAVREDVIRPRRLPRPGESICEYMFDFLCYFQTSTFFCSRELLLEVPFRKELKGFHDIDWFLRVNSHPEVKLEIVEEPLSVYHAPEQRVSITTGLDWERRLAWGKQNRELMTRRAYSRFIVGSCAGPAVRDQAGLPGLFQLLWECTYRGSPTPVNIALLLGTFLVTPGARRTLRDKWFLQNPRTDTPAGPGRLWVRFLFQPVSRRG